MRIPTITSSDPIERVASHGAISVDEQLSLRSLAEVLDQSDVGLAVVRRADGSAGVISERDITHALGQDADPDVVWVADVMSEDVVTAEVDDPIADVATQMVGAGVRHVVVVEREMIVGIASMRDVLEVLIGDVLEGRSPLIPERGDR